MRFFISILFISLLSASCFFSREKTQVVSINDLYSVEIPSFIKETKSLNDDASLQYKNFYSEYYIIVIDENKVETDSVLNETEDFSPGSLSTYSAFHTGYYCDNSDVIEKTSFTDTIINGMKAQRITLKVRIDGYDIHMLYVFIEGKEHYYQLMTWTLEGRKSRFKEQMEKSIASFKEI